MNNKYKIHKREGGIVEGAKWCNYYQCWCDDAEFIIEDNGYCDFDCNSCHHCEVSVYEDPWEE
mgnify:CR=1 FL=1